MNPLQLYKCFFSYGGIDLIDKWLLPGLQSHVDEKRNAAISSGHNKSHYVLFAPENKPFTRDEILTEHMIEIMQGLCNSSFSEILNDD